jgi:hypothetical protein
LWFNKEAFEDLLWWLYIIATVEVSVECNRADQITLIGPSILRCYDEIASLLKFAQISGYKLEKLVDLVK